MSARKGATKQATIAQPVTQTKGDIPADVQAAIDTILRLPWDAQNTIVTLIKLSMDKQACESRLLLQMNAGEIQ